MDDNFPLAMKAFDLMNIDERLLVLQIFLTLKYPHIEDRFLEAVSQVIGHRRPVP